MKQALLLIGIALAVTSCSKKFPEDDNISFRHPVKRLDGEWTPVSYLMNGEESVDSLFLYSNGCMEWIGFGCNKTTYNEPCNFWISNTAGCYRSGVFYLQKNGTIEITGVTLQVDSSGHSLSHPLGTVALVNTAVWDILKLDKNDLTLQTNYKGIEQKLIASKR